MVNDPEAQKNRADTDVQAYPKTDRSPQAGRSVLHGEIDRWGEVIRANNITVEQ